MTKRIDIPEINIDTFNETVKQVKNIIVDCVCGVVTDIIPWTEGRILSNRNDILKEIKNLEIKPKGWRTWYRENPPDFTPDTTDIKILTALYAAEKTKKMTRWRIRCKTDDMRKSMDCINMCSSEALEMAWMLMLFEKVTFLEFTPQIGISLDWSVKYKEK